MNVVNNFTIFKFIFTVLVFISSSCFSLQLIENQSKSKYFDFNEAVIGIILLFICLLYFIDITLALYNQYLECKKKYNCSDTYSFTQYIKHAIVIFFLAFSLGFIGSIESLSDNTHDIKEIHDLTTLQTHIKNCQDYKNTDRAIFTNNKDYSLLICTKEQLPSLLDVPEKEKALKLYLFYTIFQNILIALIAIELTIAYFVSGDIHSKELVTGLLIAAIIDIISYVVLKTVVAQPNLPILEPPRYDISMAYMLGSLGLMSFISSFEAIHYSQIKVDNTLDRYKVLKQLSEIIKSKGNKNKKEIQSILEDYDFLPRIKILTKIFRKYGYSVRCDDFQLLDDSSNFENYFLTVERVLIENNFNINILDAPCGRYIKNTETIECILLASGYNKDSEVIDALVKIVTNKIEVEIIKNVLSRSFRNPRKYYIFKYQAISEHDIERILNLSGYNSNRFKIEETVDIFIDNYIDNENTKSNTC